MAVNKARQKSRRHKARQDVSEVRERILRAFSERAKHSGIRSVVMGELAAELRMSATTLYNHFGSKQELVNAMVERWSEELGTEDAVILDASRSPIERLMMWADAWSRRVIQYSPAFWTDLARDYSAASGRLQSDLRRRKGKGAALLKPLLRRDLDARVALSLLDLILTHVPDPRRCDELGVSRQEAIRSALTIWARGALDGAGKLRVIRGATP